MSTQLSTKDFFSQEAVKAKFSELLGKRAPAFVTSVLQIVAQNKLLATAEPVSVYQSAAIAATLDLPVNQSLGFAWIVPYNQSVKDETGKWVKKSIAQLQIGYKGFVQLAQRTGQYKKLNVVPVHQNQFKSYDSLYEELGCDFKIKGNGIIVGYAALMITVTGFEKLVYWDKETVESHAKRYSQAYRDGKNTPWLTDFDKMAMKTVLKDMLSHWGPMSIELREAIDKDQSTSDGEKTIYPDNMEEEGEEPLSTELTRILYIVEDSTSTVDMDAFVKKIDWSILSDEEGAILNQKIEAKYLSLQEQAK